MASRLIIAGTAAAGSLLAARGVLRNWGATKAECYAALPGDEFVTDPAVVRTRAVTVGAPAESVWPWLAQIGQNRGGLYSYAKLENLLGLKIRNADTIHPEWQNLAVGDQVWLVRRNWLGLPDGVALTVCRIEPGHSLVLHDKISRGVWSFHLRDDGIGHCRLISRSRSPRLHGLGRLGDELFDPISLLMTRRMLLGIKERAERGDPARADSFGPVLASGTKG
jgi:hypothetical protein